MKYLLINKSTGQQTLCDKVTRGGFDCYVCDDVVYPNDVVYSSVKNNIVRFTDPRHFSEGTYKKVIATTNPNIDVSKVVDEVEQLAENHWKNQYIMALDETTKPYIIDDFKSGYNKAKETHPFSEEDMIELIEWMQTPAYLLNIIDSSSIKTTKELLQIWKAQQPTKVYFQ